MQAIDINNATMMHNFKPAELKAFHARYGDAKTFRSQRLVALRTAITLGDAEKEAEHLQWLLSDPRSALNAVLSVNAKLPMKRRVTLGDCEQIAASVDLSKPISEPVRIHAKSKHGGGFRVISDFGIEHRTRQHMIGDVMREYHHPQPWQFGMRGVHRAIEAVRDQVVAGTAYVAHLDITEFFGSFDFDQLPNELPIPPDVVESAVLGRYTETKLDQSSAPKGHASPQTVSALHSKARQGLPTGSSCSPIIADYVLSRLAWQIAEPGALVNVVDNLLVLAPTASDLQARIGKLHEAIGQLPGGQFKLHTIQIGETTKAFNFLGHTFTTGVSGLRIRASAANQERLFRVLQRNDGVYSSAMYGLHSKDITLAKRALVEMYAFADGWLKAFRMIDEINEFRVWVMGEIKSQAEPLGLSLSSLAKMVDPSMRYTPSGYDFTA